MNENNYKVLLKEYDKLHNLRPDIYILTFEEQIARLQKFFSKDKFRMIPTNKQIEIAITVLSHGDEMMKYYQAFLRRDMKYLNDVLFETAHLAQIGNIHNPGCDHGFYGLRITPNLLAANMMDRVEILLPNEFGLSKWNFIGASIANLLMAIKWNDSEIESDAIALAKKQLAKKNPLYYQLHIECMLAILLHDYETFNIKINEYCNAYMKSREYGMNGFNKRFCIEAHGMYNLACYAYDGEMKNHISIPNAENFCQDLAIWQNENGRIAGTSCHTFPQDLDFYNRLMNAKPVKMNLKTEGKNQYLDTDRYLEDIISENNLYF